MSLLSFTKCFISAGGGQAATALTTAMVKLAPETATAAELKNMEGDLDAAGQLISRLQRELTDERHAYDAINARYTQMMGAAEHLQQQSDAEPDQTRKTALQASLATLVARIEEMVPELDQDKKDIASTQALLTDAETAYQAKATALTEAKAKLVRARQDMEHAGIEEQRAAQRAETARAVAGLSTSSGSGINVALDAMTRTATQTRDRAAALDMKAKALTGAKAAEEDPAIAAAMAAAAGKPATATVADRLAALQQRS
jgi:chromosome segregation ATPase